MVYPLRLAAASTNSCCPTNREPGIGSSPDKRGSQYRLHQVRWWPKARPDAIAELARLAKQAASETAKVAARRELLDSAYGHVLPRILGTVEHGPSQLQGKLTAAR